MVRTGFVLLAILFISNICAAQTVRQVTATYRNHVIAGDFADPSVIRVGNTYYAAGTSPEWGSCAACGHPFVRPEKSSQLRAGHYYDV